MILHYLKKKYEISNTGNFEGKNILIESKNELNEEEQNKINKIEEKLIQERKKRVKPLFDDKSQTDLNAFWIYVNLYSSTILNDKILFEKSIKNFENFNKIYENKGNA